MPVYSRKNEYLRRRIELIVSAICNSTDIHIVRNGVVAIVELLTENRKTTRCKTCMVSKEMCDLCCSMVVASLEIDTHSAYRELNNRL